MIVEKTKSTEKKKPRNAAKFGDLVSVPGNNNRQAAAISIIAQNNPPVKCKFERRYFL